ncbi:alpha-(1,3)-fucosyltransferase C-like [Littorina saxatilis]|uniref:Fucosyltransferase n=1 Tax=Littorina saxatilis TaxID=31220 RepID=A0AAN9BZD1_9CAEN
MSLHLSARTPVSPVRTTRTVTVAILLTTCTLYVLISQLSFSPSHTYVPDYLWDQSVKKRWYNTSSQAKEQSNLSSLAKERGHTQSRMRDLGNSSSQLTLPKSLMFITDISFPGRNGSSGVVRELKSIFLFNRPSWFRPNGLHSTQAFAGCDFDTCLLTDNETEREGAAAIMFHMCSGLRHPLPFQVDQRQVWIAFGLESPPHCGHYRNPYSRKFNWTMTYRTDSDVFYPYDQFHFRQTPAEKNFTALVSGKSKPVAWFVSNCQDHSKRKEYAKELSKHIQVDIYGACGSFSCPRSKTNDCKRLLNTAYFFYLSFENSLCRDYMTEKVFKLYDNVDVIPVVRGRVDYKRYLPPGTFLDTADFRTPRELALRLTSLMADKKAYTKMLTLKDRFSTGAIGYDPTLCRLCEKLHVHNVSKTYPDLQKWASEGICRDADDV